MQNGAGTLEDSLAVSYQSQRTLTIWSSNHAPRHLPKGVETPCAQKACTHVVFGLMVMWRVVSSFAAHAPLWWGSWCRAQLHMCGVGHPWRSSVPSLQFCWEPETVLKSSSLQKTKNKTKEKNLIDLNFLIHDKPIKSCTSNLCFQKDVNSELIVIEIRKCVAGLCFLPWCLSAWNWGCLLTSFTSLEGILLCQKGILFWKCEVKFLSIILPRPLCREQLEKQQQPQPKQPTTPRTTKTQG